MNEKLNSWSNESMLTVKKRKLIEDNMMYDASNKAIKVYLFGELNE